MLIQPMCRTLCLTLLSVMANVNREHVFRFKQFEVRNRMSAMKVGTDGVLLGAWCHVAGCRRVLDIGAGTGLISLMIAQREPDAFIDAVEIERDAAAEARDNFDSSPWSDRLRVIEADFNRWTAGIDAPYDLIVSNPPYFNSELKAPDASRALARHGEGLTYDSIVKAAASGLLSPEGRLCMISPVEREGDIMFSAAMARMSLARLTRVVTRPSTGRVTRLLWELSLGDAVTVEDVVTVGSPDYNDLVSAFYLDKS